MRAMSAVREQGISVLMVAPGRGVQGGMTELLKQLGGSLIWSEYNCEWLETCDRRNRATNLFAFIRGAMRFPAAIHGKTIVHIHAGSGTSFIRKVLFFFAAKLSGRKIVLQLHVTDALFRGVPETLITRVLKGADTVLVLSERFATDLRRRVPGIPIYVIGNPVAAPALRPVQSARDAITILFLGRMEERKKGVRDLIEAFAPLARKHPSARLYLAGSGDATEAKNMSAALGIGKSVHFPGWLEGDRKAEALRRADIFCLPSYEEALPLALLEAMSYGVPAVCTDVGAIPEVLIDGQTGILFKPGDIAGLTAALDTLIDSPRLRHEFAMAAAKAACQYRPDAVWRRLSEVYDQVASGVSDSVRQQKAAI